MLKAAREAKQRTSWTETDAPYEEALLQFVRSVLEPRDNNLFLGDFVEFQRPVARFGLLNGLSQTLCKLTAPGVPDIYQGTRSGFLAGRSRQSPCGRLPVPARPVERAAVRRRAARGRGAHGGRALQAAAHLEDPAAAARAPATVSRRRLPAPARARQPGTAPVRLRSSLPAAVAAGHCAAPVPAPARYEGRLPLGDAVWSETLIELPREERSRVSFRNVLDGAQLMPVRQGESVGVLAAHALAEFPVALLTCGCDEPGADPGGATPHAAAVDTRGTRKPNSELSRWRAGRSSAR